jgi:hypothetical protein
MDSLPMIKSIPGLTKAVRFFETRTIAGCVTKIICMMADIRPAATKKFEMRRPRVTSIQTSATP